MRRPRRWRRPSGSSRPLAAAGATRSDHVVALGGGVVGDLAGFCAASYQRGVPVIQVPTSLLAQVDSAYGGKTGVDLGAAKNYVGAYHQPAAVLADTGTLATLPAEELASGFVEVIKTALLAGGDVWERVRGLRALDRRRARTPGLRLRGDQARGRGLRRARRLAAGDPQPGPYRRPRGRGGRLLRGLPPRRGRWARIAGRAAAERCTGTSRRGGRAAGLPRAAGVDWTSGSTSTK